MRPVPVPVSNSRWAASSSGVRGGSIVSTEVLQAEQELERLDAMARELSAIGSVRLMVDAIHHLQGKQEADRLRGPQRSHPPAKSPQELDAQQVRPWLPVFPHTAQRL